MLLQRALKRIQVYLSIYQSIDRSFVEQKIECTEVELTID